MNTSIPHSSNAAATSSRASVLPNVNDDEETHARLELSAVAPHILAEALRHVDCIVDHHADGRVAMFDFDTFVDQADLPRIVAKWALTNVSIANELRTIVAGLLASHEAEDAESESFDFDAFAEFMQSLGIDWRTVAFQSYREKPRGRSKGFAVEYGDHAKARTIAPGDVDGIRRDHDVHRMAVTAGIVPRARRADDVTSTSIIVAEFDKAFPTEWPTGCYPTRIVETSPGRFHLYWRLAEPVTLKQAQSMLYGIVEKMGAEREMVPTFWMARAVGSLHRKDGVPFRVTDVTADWCERFEEHSDRIDPAALLVAFVPPVTETPDADGVLPDVEPTTPKSAKSERRAGPRGTYEPPSHSRDLNEALDILAVVPSDDRLRQWLPVGLLLCGWLGSDGLPIWDSWSSRSTKYAENERGQIEREWKRFNRLKGYFRNPKAALLSMAARYQSDIRQEMGRKYPSGTATGTGRVEESITRTAPSATRITGFSQKKKARRKTALHASMDMAERLTYDFALDQYDGSNNGKLHLSARRVEDHEPIGKNLAAGALKRLVDKGVLRIVRQYQKPGQGQGRCALYALCEYEQNFDAEGNKVSIPPTLDWDALPLAPGFEQDATEARRSKRTFRRAKMAGKQRRKSTASRTKFGT